MSTAAENVTPPAPRRRGRPPGARDTKPRKRRSRAELVTEPGKPASPAKKPKESQMQAQFIAWLATQPAPDLPGCKLGDFAHAVPNGIWIPGEPHVRMRIIVSQRRMGMKKGVPDVTLALPLNGWHGCYIELKRDKVALEPERIREEQVEWCERLRKVGYFVAVAVGVEGACEAVRRYVAGEPPLPFPWEDRASYD